MSYTDELAYPHTTFLRPLHVFVFPTYAVNPGRFVHFDTNPAIMSLLIPTHAVNLCTERLGGPSVLRKLSINELTKKSKKGGVYVSLETVQTNRRTLELTPR